MTIEHKTVGVKGLNVVDAKQGIVETVISVTGVVDNVKDRIMPGAYTKTLATRTPKGVWSHDWNEPVSKTLTVKELMPGDSNLPPKMPNGNPWPREAGALMVKTQFNLETQRGREAFSDVVFFGADQEWSIGYQVPVGGAKVDPQSGVREINFLELYEYSPVLFGAMPLARTTSVKDAQYAYKALMDAPADDDAAVEGDEEVAPDEYGDEDDDDDVEGKSTLGGDQMILVKTAIQTLSDLLEAVQTEYKVDDGDEGGYDDDAEDMGEDEGDEEGDYGSLAEAVDDIAGDAPFADSLGAAADGIDSAVANDDAQALEAATTTFLDVVEQNLGGDSDVELKELAQILGDLIEQVSVMSPSGDEEVDMEGKEAMCDDCGKPMSECECENPGKTDTATLLNADEIKSALAAFDV
jgi:phage head maturation protease